MEIPFITSQVHEGNYPINFMFQPEGYNGRPALVGTPGLELFCSTGGGEVRCLHSFGGYLYAVVGSKVYKIDSIGNETELASGLETSSGWVTSADDGTNIMFVDGTAGYVVVDVTLTKITAAGFPVPSCLTYQDGYFIVTEKDTGSFFISGLYDPTTWDALDFSSAEGSPDKGLSIKMDHRELFIFGEKSVEVFYNTGATDFPFERIGGAFLEKGISAPASVAKVDNSVFFLADDFTVRRISEYSPIVVSPAALNQIIADYGTKSDARAYSYYDDGNAFYVLTFPSENVTWVFNAATGFWHQWASEVAQNRHRGITYAFYNNKHYVGDYGNGSIYRVRHDVYTDNGTNIKRTRVAPPVMGGNRESLFFHRLEVEFKAGVGNLGSPTLLGYAGDNLAPMDSATTPDAGLTVRGSWLSGNAYSQVATSSGGYDGYFLSITNTGGGTFYAYIYVLLATEIGKSYRLSLYYRANFDDCLVKVGTSKGAGDISTSAVLSETSWTAYTVDFTAEGGSTYISLSTATTDHAGRCFFDYVSVIPAMYEYSDIDPEVMLDWSNDNGRTWSNERWAKIGKLGEYLNRCCFRRLGKARNRLYRLSMTDPVEAVITGVYADIEQGRH